MDERSIRIQERLNTPMLIAAALTLPTVAITESKPGGTLEAVVVVLNWVTWLAFLVELVVMLSVVPNKKAWLRRHPLDIVIVFLTPPILPPGLQGLRVLRLLRPSACCGWPNSRARSSHWRACATRCCLPP